MRRIFALAFLAFTRPCPAAAHAPPTRVVEGPLRVSGNALLDRRVKLIYDGLPSSQVSVGVAEASPGDLCRFFRRGEGNQDGALNSQAAPALRGSIVVLFATGAGQLSPARPEGSPAVHPLGAPALPVSVRIGSVPAEIVRRRSTWPDRSASIERSRSRKRRRASAP